MTASRDLERLLTDWHHADSDFRADDVAAAAVATLASGSGDRDLWRRFLETSGEQPFLAALPDREARHVWADVAFSAIRRADFGLAELLDWRVRSRPDVVFLRDLGQAGEPAMTYDRVQRRIRRIAACLLGPTPDETSPPRVALLTANTLDGALCDLACLLHDIFVAPLNVQEDAATLAWICNRLAITDLVVDGPDRLQRALDVRDRIDRPFTIHLLQPCGSRTDEDLRLLEEDLSALAPGESDARVAKRPRLALDDPCTVLFTSGSTGRPKGIVFTPFNLVSKRFARAAALPSVGTGEVLVSYLPLYHTFGRFLEMLGMLYWGGTYVFAGSPSRDALLAGMARHRPTGLVSVPLRWQQIRDLSDESGGTREALDTVTGGRLRWGLSAAGWLSPDTFRWYHGRGVELCSGFGMTEGTGGLTMTPPQEYVEESVGLPLPGVRTRLGDDGELQVAGPYVAHYLPEDGEPGDMGGSHADDEEYWLGTGDLFQELPGGHLQIVDRIKDIYKNNRGQTVAPRKVESRFVGVPGIARTFLAGDGRAYNVLLIVPDTADPVLENLDTDERQQYFREIIRQANLDLAAYERVVSFGVLDRDFTEADGELTAKGSYRRKTIAANFRDVLEDLYRRHVLIWNDRHLVLPDWVVRDLGVFEDEITVDGDDLLNRRSGARLPLAASRRTGWLRIGDLEYHPFDPSRDLDLGLLARQPLLWSGNPTLQAFLPCRDDWDARLANVDDQVLLPPRTEESCEPLSPPRRKDRLGVLDELIRQALFLDFDAALAAVHDLDGRLPQATPREALLIRRRLEALANHPRLELRCEAYRILVLDDPEPDYGRYLAAFVDSGQPFLCPDSIDAIAGTAGESRRLLSFRRRLHAYRQQLHWPATPAVRSIFVDLLQLLVDFARHQPENISTVRREMLCWVLFDGDAALANHAQIMLDELTTWHQERLEATAPPQSAWSGLLSFQDGLTDDEIASLERVLLGTTFLAESTIMSFDAAVDPSSIPPGNVWVSRTHSAPQRYRYRVSINTTSGRHFDLLVVLREDLEDPAVKETFQWVAAIRGWPTDAPVMPRLGAVRPDLGAASLEFTSGLTLWDHVRLHAATHDAVSALGRTAWRRLFVSGMATVITAWDQSRRTIVPGLVTPSNVMVPDRDWQRDRVVISLTGWCRYTGPLDLARPLLKNFLRLAPNHHPALRDVMDDDWLGEAVAEALGQTDGRLFLEELATALELTPLAEGGPELTERIREKARDLAVRYHAPLAVESAAARYHDWADVNPDASPRARSDQIESLIRLYRLDSRELARFTLFGKTYLADATAEAQQACEQLVSRLFRYPQQRAARTVELSDLQAALDDPDDRAALGRLAFPQSAHGRAPHLTPVGDRAREHVVLQTEIRDDHDEIYIVREPRDAAELGKLYRLFLLSGFPLAISESDRLLVTLDDDGQLAGGVVWRPDADVEPHLDGVVVVGYRRGRGLARVILEDFCQRLANDGHKILRTHFSLQGFFSRLGFQLDQQRGGLVRRLG